MLPSTRRASGSADNDLASIGCTWRGIRSPIRAKARQRPPSLEPAARATYDRRNHPRIGEVTSELKAHEDAEVARLRAAARDMLVDALRECGYIDAQSVHLAMKRRNAEGTLALVVPARTIGRYMKDGPPPTPQGGTYEAFVALGQLAHVRDELLEACQRLWARTRIGAARAPQEQESWYQIIPVQAGRTYASIDVVTFSRISDDEIRGTI